MRLKTSARFLALTSLCFVLACSDDDPDNPDGSVMDAAIDIPAVDCDAVEAAGYTLCSAEATQCGLIFLDGTGCAQACSDVGLGCVQSYDTIVDACTEDLSLPLDCAETSHDSDYCVCGPIGGPDAGPGPDGGVMDGSIGDAGPEDSGSPSELLAFPTARGAGAYVTGGRGGAVVQVTRLDDPRDADGDAMEGTLRWALTRPYPRTIVFRVSGTIVIGDNDGDGVVDAGGTYPTMLALENPDFSNFTVAGQTAPEGGITIKGFFYMSRVSNMIWRYVRIRKDAVFNGFDALGIRATRDVILDHLSVSYGTDEGASISNSEDGPDQYGVTLQYNLIAESKTGSIVGGISSTGNENTVVNNFYTRISHRFPNLGGPGRHDVFNNLVYNWNSRLVNVHNSAGVNHINNAYVAGPRTRDNTEDVANKVHMGTDGAIDARIYTAGNFISRLLEDPAADNWVSWQVFVSRNGYEEGDPAPAVMQAGEAFPMVGLPATMRTAEQVMAQLPDEVGAFRTLGEDGSIIVYRDGVDSTYIAEYRSNTGPSTGLEVDDFVYPEIPSNAPYADTDGDGMPDVWESANGFNPEVADDAGDADGDGYTNLEEFLNLVDR